jgi:hypothetical protein
MQMPPTGHHSVTHFVEVGERRGKNRHSGRARQTWHEARRRFWRGGGGGEVWHGVVEEELGAGAGVIGRCSKAASLRRSLGAAPSGRCLGAVTVRRSSRAAPSKRTSLGADEDKHQTSLSGGD